MIFLAPLVLVLAAGCGPKCEYDGYQALVVELVSGAPAVSQDGAVCTVYTDLPTDTRDPDKYRPDLAEIGRAVYSCLLGTAPLSQWTPDQAFYSEWLWFRIDGQCPPGAYGCFAFDCRKIDTNLQRIGPACEGVAMQDWSEACWDQFYAVIGHEVMHGWLGAFHK